MPVVVDPLSGAVVVVLYVGGRMILVDGGLDPEPFIVFLAAALKLSSPIKYLSKLNEDVQPALAACERIFDVVDTAPEVVEAAKGQAEVLLDGGIRRGSDVVKALCLGAKAVLIGRAYAYGLAAGLWTSDLSTAQQVARAQRAGQVWDNCSEEGELTVPFGGTGSGSVDVANTAVAGSQASMSFSTSSFERYAGHDARFQLARAGSASTRAESHMPRIAR